MLQTLLIPLKPQQKIVFKLIFLVNRNPSVHKKTRIDFFFVNFV